MKIRAIAEQRYGARAGEQFDLQTLADTHGEDAVLDWLKVGLPTPRLDLPELADLLAAGVTVQRFRWLVSG
jgi:hypothetical protein